MSNAFTACEEKGDFVSLFYFIIFLSQNPQHTFQIYFTMPFYCDIVVLILFRKVVLEQYPTSPVFSGLKPENPTAGGMV